MEIKDFVTLFFSALSVAISSFTFYWNIVRDVKFVKTFIIRVTFSYLEAVKPLSGTLPYIYLDLPIINIGSRTGVINTIYIELINSSTGKKYTFPAFREGEVSIQNGDVPSQIIIPFSVKPNEGIIKHITFLHIPEKFDFSYQEGKHKLKVYAILASRKPKHELLTEQIVDIKGGGSIHGFSENKFILQGSVPFPTKIITVSPALVVNRLPE